MSVRALTLTVAPAVAAVQRAVALAALTCHELAWDYEPPRNGGSSVDPREKMAQWVVMVVGWGWRVDGGGG